jgi:hypothetical protein
VLCEKSTYNCYQCHKGELDLLLLKFLETGGDVECAGFKFPKISLPFDEILGFVSFLVSVYTSPYIVFQFLALAQPDFRVLASLRDTLMGCHRQIIPIGFDNRDIESIDFMTGSVVDGGFRLQVLFRLDTTLSEFLNSQISLLSLLDNSVKIHFVIMGSELVIRVQSVGALVSEILHSDFQPNLWINLEISFLRQSNEIMV